MNRQTDRQTDTETYTNTYLFFILDLVSSILSVFETILMVISPEAILLLCRKEFTRSSRNVSNRVVGNPTTEKSSRAFVHSFIILRLAENLFSFLERPCFFEQM